MKNDRFITRGMLLATTLLEIFFLNSCGDPTPPTPELDTDTKLSAFSINDVDFNINATDKTVQNEDGLPYGTDVTGLVATFTVPSKAKVMVGEVEQESGVAANDFTNPVTYTIVAEDAAVKLEFTVTVNVSATAWKLASENAYVGLRRPAAIAHDGKLFLLGGAEVGGNLESNPKIAPDYYEYVYSSEDGGASWTTVQSHDGSDLANSDSIPIGSYLSAVSFDNKIITVGGQGAPEVQYGVLLKRPVLGSASSSDNGSSWTVTEQSALSIVSSESGIEAIKPGLVVHNNEMYMLGYMPVVFGTEQTISRMDVLKSTDGIRWNMVNEDALSTIKTLDNPPTLAVNFTFNNSLFIAGGISGAAFITSTQDIYSTAVFKSDDNGASWRVASPDGFPAVAATQVVEYKGKLVAIAGGTGDGSDAVYTKDVYVSEDGATWVKQTEGLAFPEAFQGRAFHNVVVLDDKIYVIGGENASGSLRDVWVGAFEFSPSTEE